MSTKILVIEDDHATSRMVVMALKSAGYEATAARTLQQARSNLNSERFDLILSDLYLGDGTGLELLKEIKNLCPIPDIPLVMFTAKGTVETAVEAMREGAFDYLAKPFSIDELLRLVKRAIDSIQTAEVGLETVSSDVETSLIIGNSPSMVKLYKEIALAAPTDVPVLITGETGTGKELVARCLHEFSGRKERPFVALNCGSLPETLLESELFGHEKGAFTGAITAREGLFESARGGTLLLDEISETSLNFQVKLLRVLQEKEIRPVGSRRVLATDVRIVAASNRNLEEEIAEKRFRQDLYYRLSVVHLSIPPLRDRPQDIRPLARFFLSGLNSRLKRKLEISESALRWLSTYDWPGNVRELENALERIAVLKTDSLIMAEDLSFLESAQAPANNHLTQLSELELVERDKIISVLTATRGNKAEAARRLGIERKTLYRKAHRLAIDLDSISTKFS